MELGAFGGTFNPVHLGHLRAAEEVAEALGLTRLLFLPARVPPHKAGAGLLPAATRLELLGRAVADNPRFEVSDLELRRSGPSYSVDTLTELRRGLGPGDRLWFLVGADAFRELHTWHRFPEVFGLADLAVMRRPPDTAPLAPPTALVGEFAPSPDGYRHASGREIRFVPVTLFDISSTQVRRALGRGSSIRYLVPDVLREPLEALARAHPPWLGGLPT